MAKSRNIGMKLDEARRVLVQGAGLPQLMEAVGVMKHDGLATISDLLLGLTHAECVAEQAALALYKRAGRPLPPVGQPISIDAAEWRMWLASGDGKSRSAALLDRPTSKRMPSVIRVKARPNESTESLVARFKAELMKRRGTLAPKKPGPTRRPSGTGRKPAASARKP